MDTYTGHPFGVLPPPHAEVSVEPPAASQHPSWAGGGVKCEEPWFSTTPPPPPPPEPISAPPHAEFAIDNIRGGAICSGAFNLYPPHMSAHRAERTMAIPVRRLVACDVVQFPIPHRTSLRPFVNAEDPTRPGLVGDDLRDTDLGDWRRRIEVVFDARGSARKYLRIVYKNRVTKKKIFGDIDKHDVLRAHRVFSRILNSKRRPKPALGVCGKHTSTARSSL